MDLQHVSVKFFVAGDLSVEQMRFIEIFHAWIRDHRLDELLLDVADYRHVPQGPRVLLVGHDADYCIEDIGNRWGLRYKRKSAVEGSNAGRLVQAIGAAAGAALKLEEDTAADGSLKFDTREFEISINDRALAPNRPESYAECQSDIHDCIAKILGHDDFSMTPESDPRRVFGLLIKSNQPFDLATLV